MDCRKEGKYCSVFFHFFSILCQVFRWPCAWASFWLLSLFWKSLLIIRSRFVRHVSGLQYYLSCVGVYYGLWFAGNENIVPLISLCQDCSFSPKYFQSTRLISFLLLPYHSYVQVKLSAWSEPAKGNGKKPTVSHGTALLQAAHSAAPDVKCFPTLYITMPAFITPPFERGVDRGTESWGTPPAVSQGSCTL